MSIPMVAVKSVTAIASPVQQLENIAVLNVRPMRLCRVTRVVSVMMDMGALLLVAMNAMLLVRPVAVQAMINALSATLTRLVEPQLYLDSALAAPPSQQLQTLVNATKRLVIKLARTARPIAAQPVPNATQMLQRPTEHVTVVQSTIESKQQDFVRSVGGIVIRV
jgi:hypothetical protein